MQFRWTTNLLLLLSIVQLEMYCSDANSMRAVPAKVFRIDTRVDFVILKFVGEV